MNRPVSSLLLVCILPFTVWAHGDLHEQIAATTRALEQTPNNPELHLRRAELHRAHRDWNLALADLERASKAAPDLIVIDFYRGRILLEANRAGDAVRSLDSFLARQPDHGEALITRARALAKLGRNEHAAADYTRALGLTREPQPEQYLERAHCLAAVEPSGVDAALRSLDEGIKKLGSLVTLQQAAIDLELRRKNFDGALQRLDQVAKQFHRQETWLTRRGEILRQAGRMDESKQAFAAALHAIESLPSRSRETQAVRDLEQRLRAELRIGTTAATTLKAR